MKLEYNATIENGRMVMGTNVRKRMAEEVRRFDGRAVIVSVEPKRRTRSPEQNRYYWGVIVAHVLAFLKDCDPTTLATPDLAHEYLKRRFLPMVTDWAEVEIQTPDNRPETFYTTTNLSTSQFLDYTTLIQEWLAEFGWVVPDPDEFIFESVEAVDINRR